MRTYTVHARDDAPADGEADRRFVKEGFSWPALFVPLLWLLFHRMWLPLLGWLAAGVALSAAGTVWPASEGAVTAAALLFALWFAFEANGLRRWSLDRKGWPMVDIVNGRDRWEAELSHFRKLALGAAPPARAPGAARAAVPGAPRRGDAVVGGLFPEGGR